MTQTVHRVSSSASTELLTCLCHQCANIPSLPCTCMHEKGLSNRFCPSVSLSVCQSSEKFWNQHIYWVKQFLYVVMTWQSTKNNACIPGWGQSSSLLCISTSFLFKIGIVHHFDMVNWWWSGICGLLARARDHQPFVPRIAKVRWGPANEAAHSRLWHELPFDRSVKYGMLLVWKSLNALLQAWWGWSVTSRGQSFTLWGQSVTLQSWSANICWLLPRGVAGWAQVDLQLESIKTLWYSIPTTLKIPYVIDVHCIPQMFNLCS